MSKMNDIKQISNLYEMINVSDFISLHIPYIEGETDNLLNKDILDGLNKNTNILNFSEMV